MDKREEKCKILNDKLVKLLNFYIVESLAVSASFKKLEYHHGDPTINECKYELQKLSNWEDYINKDVSLNFILQNDRENLTKELINLLNTFISDNFEAAYLVTFDETLGAYNVIYLAILFKLKEGYFMLDIGASD